MFISPKRTVRASAPFVPIYSEKPACCSFEPDNVFLAEKQWDAAL
jgi:hypothetical protein